MEGKMVKFIHVNTVLPFSYHLRKQRRRAPTEGTTQQPKSLTLQTAIKLAKYIVARRLGRNLKEEEEKFITDAVTEVTSRQGRDFLTTGSVGVLASSLVSTLQTTDLSLLSEDEYKMLINHVIEPHVAPTSKDQPPSSFLGISERDEKIFRQLQGKPIPVGELLRLYIIDNLNKQREQSDTKVLCLVGPPGIGKTTIVQEAAKSLGLNVYVLPLQIVDPTLFAAPYVGEKKVLTEKEFHELLDEAQKLSREEIQEAAQSVGAKDLSREALWNVSEKITFSRGEQMEINESGNFLRILIPSPEMKVPCKEGDYLILKTESGYFILAEVVWVGSSIQEETTSPTPQLTLPQGEQTVGATPEQPTEETQQTEQRLGVGQEAWGGKPTIPASPQQTVRKVSILAKPEKPIGDLASLKRDVLGIFRKELVDKIYQKIGMERKPHLTHVYLEYFFDPSYVIFFDDADKASPATLSALLPVLTNRKLGDEAKGEARDVKALFIFAANDASFLGSVVGLTARVFTIQVAPPSVEYWKKLELERGRGMWGTLVINYFSRDDVGIFDETGGGELVNPRAASALVGQADRIFRDALLTSLAALASGYTPQEIGSLFRREEVEGKIVTHATEKLRDEEFRNWLLTRYGEAVGEWALAELKERAKEMYMDPISLLPERFLIEVLSDLLRAEGKEVFKDLLSAVNVHVAITIRDLIRDYPERYISEWNLMVSELRGFYFPSEHYKIRDERTGKVIEKPNHAEVLEQVLDLLESRRESATFFLFSHFLHHIADPQTSRFCPVCTSGDNLKSVLNGLVEFLKISKILQKPEKDIKEVEPFLIPTSVFVSLLATWIMGLNKASYKLAREKPEVSETFYRVTNAFITRMIEDEEVGSMFRDLQTLLANVQMGQIRKQKSLVSSPRRLLKITRRET